MLDLVYSAGQVFCAIGLAYGAYVSLTYSFGPHEPKESPAPVISHT